MRQKKSILQLVPLLLLFLIFSLAHASAAVMLSCSLPANAIVGVTYSGKCTATGGTGTYTYSIVAGAPLPGGLSIKPSTGDITGTPTTADSSTFTVKVVDSGSPQQTASQSLTITVIAALNITTTTLSNGIVGIVYSASCSATGGTKPYTFSVVPGTQLPGGLSLNPANCAITGTPATAGPFNFTIKVVDSGTPQQSDTQSLAITISPALAITSTAPPNGAVGVAYSFNLTAQNGALPYTWSISPNTLPPGLGLNASTGVISGTPTTAGSFTFPVSVSDTDGQTTSPQSLTITIIPALKITTTTFLNGVVEVAYSASCSVTGGFGTYTFSIAAGTQLPSGLSLNPANCAITGTPTASGTSNFSITVTDSGTPQQTYTQPNLAITIVPTLKITTTSLPNGVIGLAYSTSCSATGGVGTYTFSISGSLPGGLSLNPANCAITGTLTATGTFNFSITATDSGTPQQSSKPQPLSITINPALVVTSGTPPNWAANVQGYVFTLTALNGTQPYTWSITSGAPPPGLTLNSATGTISGTPTTPGTYSFAATVTDNGSPKQAVTTQSFTVTIATGLIVATTSVPNGFTGQAYSATLAAQNGKTPYTWRVASGALPTGLTLNASSGTIAGIPTAVGTYAFIVVVTDSTPTQSAPQSLTLTVTPGLTITTSGLSTATVAVPYSATLAAQNGMQPYAWALSAGSSLPPGLTLAAGGTISGTPTTPGTYPFTVTVTDSPQAPETPQSASLQFSIVVNPASAPVVPSFSFTGLPTTSPTAGQTIPGPTVALSPVSSTAWLIVVQLGFTANAAGVPAGYMDPALQFIDGSGNKLGTTYSLTVPAMSSSVPPCSATVTTLCIPQIQVGTVAGTISLTLSVQGQTGATSTITLPPSAPIISSVQILSVTATGFDVEIIANSSPRDLATAAFTFGAAGGAQITGTSTFSIDVSSVMTTWFAGSAGQSYGSAFSLTVPFTFTGSSAAISSVSVTLTNSMGTSAAATGTK